MKETGKKKKVEFKSGTIFGLNSLADGVVVDGSDFTIFALRTLDRPGVDVLVLNNRLGGVLFSHSFCLFLCFCWTRVNLSLNKDQVSRGRSWVWRGTAPSLLESELVASAPIESIV
jgi:hypothetical protein